MSTNRSMHSCGKSKVMYKTEDAEYLIMKFMDSVSSYTQNKNERIEGTGIVRASISAELFRVLEGNGIKTHFVEQVAEGELKVKVLDMLKLEVIPRNYAAGSIVRQFPVIKGQKFDPPVLKLDLKYGADPMLNTDYAVALGVATRKELQDIREIAFEVNRVLTQYLIQRDLILVDFKIEVGKDINGNIIVGDEISPDGMRMWDAKTKDSLDKDVFRYNLGDLVGAYKEVQRRMKI